MLIGTKPSGKLRCPSSYEEILTSGLRPGIDFRLCKGNLEVLASCLLAAPHGGKIEPFTSNIVKAVGDLGHWAWYSFEGKLPARNWQRLHITSTTYDEPLLRRLLPRTAFVLAIHGMGGVGRQVEVGGAFGAGRALLAEHLSEALNPWGATIFEADGTGARGHLGGLHRSNLVNRGARGEGVQIEISRGLRNLLRADKRAFQSVCCAIDGSLRELTRASARETPYP